VQENENCVAKEIKQEEGKQSLVESEDSLTIQLVEISETNSSEDKKKLKRSKLNLSEKSYQEDVRMKNFFIYLFATKIIKNYNIQF